MNEKKNPESFPSKPARDSADAPSRPAKERMREWNLSWDLAGRIGLLFVALCSIKVAMLAGFRVHLFEIHWRLLVSRPHEWIDQAAFLTFVTLVIANLWCLGNRCAVEGVRMVRAANLCVLALGISFIFLASYANGKHYFCSLMNGTGTWRDTYLVFFSGPPVWSFWLLIYALFYFVFVRAGMERHILRVTGVLGALYVLLFLRYLLNCREALLAVDCLGAACLLAGMGSKEKLSRLWLILPCLCFPFFFLIFRGQADDITVPGPEFLVLTGWMLVITIGVSAVAWREKFYAAWSWLLPFALASSLLLVNANYDFASNYQNLLTMGLLLPHYFIGEFILAAALLAVAMVYRRFLPTGSLWWLDVLNLLLIAFALADLRLTEIMEVRLDWQAVNIAGGFVMMWRQAKPYLPDMLFGLVMLISLYAVVIGFLSRAGSQKVLRPTRNGVFFLIALLLLALTGRFFTSHDKAEGESAILLAQTSPLFNWADNPVMEEKTFIATARQLGMEPMLARPATAAARSPRDLNVVLIFQESSYNKYLSLFDNKTNTEPLLSKYQDRMELFPNFFTDFPGSVNARFAALSGLYPVRNYEAFTFHRVDVESIFDILHQYGYVSSVFASDSFDYTDFRDFLRDRGIETMYDANTMPGHENGGVSWGVKEEVTLKAIQSQIRKYAGSHQKFFLSYFPVAPHNPFDGTPPQFQKFPVAKKNDYVPQYENELLYLDWVISSIVDELKNNGLLDQTLVIITDDHGEMLGVNGGPIGHGWAVTPRLANIPLMIMDPGNPGYHVNDTVGSQVDLLPTVLDLLGIPLPQNQLYQGVSLYSPRAQDPRTIYLNSFQEYGVLEGRELVCGDRETEALNSTNNASFNFYAITNNGARTMFPKMKPSDVLPPPISEFDRFQENFLQNYSQYRQMIRSTPDKN